QNLLLAGRTIAPPFAGGARLLRDCSETRHLLGPRKRNLRLGGDEVMEQFHGAFDDTAAPDVAAIGRWAWQAHRHRLSSIPYEDDIGPDAVVAFPRDDCVDDTQNPSSARMVLTD